MVEAIGFDNDAISKTVSGSTCAGSPTLRMPYPRRNRTWSL